MNIKRILAALLLPLLLFPGCASYPSYSNPEEAELLRNTTAIIHAAGRVGEDTGYPFDGANSMEGLLQSAEAGCTVIELDFNFTADGALVCIHDWYTQYSTAITDNVPLTLAEFQACRIYDLYTPVWLDSLAEFLTEHEEIYIVTDIKDDNLAGAAAIANAYPELKNRFIIQIYHGDEYAPVRELGFEYVIYTLYRLDWKEKTDTKALKKFADNHPLIGYTFSYELCEVENYVENMRNTGVPLFVHTVNDPAEKQSYYSQGITGIYTDTRD